MSGMEDSSWLHNVSDHALILIMRESPLSTRSTKIWASPRREYIGWPWTEATAEATAIPIKFSVAFNIRAREFGDGLFSSGIKCFPALGRVTDDTAVTKITALFHAAKFPFTAKSSRSRGVIYVWLATNFARNYPCNSTDRRDTLADIAISRIRNFDIYPRTLINSDVLRK